MYFFCELCIVISGVVFPRPPPPAPAISHVEIQTASTSDVTIFGNRGLQSNKVR